MIFTFAETPASGQVTFDPPTATGVWKAVGETNELTVLQYAINATPLVVYHPKGVLKRQDIKVDPDGWGQYVVTVPYSKKERATGAVTFNFDTTGATINVKAAKQHIRSYPDDGDWHRGAIGVKGDGDVEGVDIVIPALKINYGFKHPEGVVTEQHARTLSAATGRVNGSEFRGFPAGELLFGGATGSDGTNAEAEVNYQFVAVPNESALSIGDITGIVKQGHHVAWIEFEDEVHDGYPVKRPVRVHVDRVYDQLDFAAYFGWG